MGMLTFHSDICFVPAEGPHFVLSHDLIEKWAAEECVVVDFCLESADCVPMIVLSCKRCLMESTIVKILQKSVRSILDPSL